MIGDGRSEQPTALGEGQARISQPSSRAETSSPHPERRSRLDSKAVAAAAAIAGVIAGYKGHASISTVLNEAQVYAEAISRAAGDAWGEGPIDEARRFRQLEDLSSNGPMTNYRASLDTSMISDHELPDPKDEGLRRLAQLNGVIVRFLDSDEPVSAELLTLVRDARVAEGISHPSILDLGIVRNEDGILAVNWQDVVWPVGQGVVSEDRLFDNRVDRRDQRWSSRVGPMSYDGDKLSDYLVTAGEDLYDTFFGITDVSDHLKNMGDFGTSGMFVVNVRRGHKLDGEFYILHLDDKNFVYQVLLRNNPKYKNGGYHPRMVDDEFLAEFRQLNVKSLANPTESK